MERKLTPLEDKVLTTKDLAERWGVNPQHIRNMVNAGQLTKLPHLPRMKFLLSYIEAYEDELMKANETDQLTTRREVNKLRREIIRLKEELNEKDEHIRKVNKLIRQIQVELF